MHMARYRALAMLVFVLMLAPLAVDLLGLATAVVKAQTATAVALGAGKPVVLNTTFTISPGDAIAPHLYTWYFDGVNDYIQVSYSSIFNGWNAITVLSWANTPSIYNSYQPIATRWSSSTGFSWWFGFPQFYSIFFQISSYYVQSSGTISLCTWNHLAVSWYSGQTPNLYINSVKQSFSRINWDVSSLTSIPDINAPIYIGYYGSGLLKGYLSQRFWVGAVSRPYILQRYALPGYFRL
jgi:hypothetical protein